MLICIQVIYIQKVLHPSEAAVGSLEYIIFKDFISISHEKELGLFTPIGCGTIDPHRSPNRPSA